MAKTKWKYDYSQPLKMGFAHRKTKKGIEVMIEDKTRYFEDEIKVLSKYGGITPEIHTVKRIFMGIVSEYEKKM